MISNEMTPVRRSLNLVARVWRMPLGHALAIVIVSVPSILLWPEAGILVELAALCLYPVLDIPRILTLPSWWRGAMLAAVVWFVVFFALVGIADTVHPLRENAMIFLLPFMLYPLALAIAGIVRLEGRLSRRPPESVTRIGAVVVGVTVGLIVVGPILTGMIPRLMPQFTGNSPENWVYSGEGDVLAATSDRVNVRLTGTSTDSFRLSPETTFVFMGPGSALVTGTAGPEWLEPGQRIGLHYVVRDHEARVENVSIWIDRTDCPGDAKWAAASQAPASSQADSSLAGTTWDGVIDLKDAQGRPETTILEFRDRNRLTFTDKNGILHEDGLWKQNGQAILLKVYECHGEYDGRIEGDAMSGQYSSTDGTRASWTARRRAGVSAK